MNKFDKINRALRIYIYCALVVKFVTIIKVAIELHSFSYFFAELVAFTIILVSPICDYLITRSKNDDSYKQ